MTELERNIQPYLDEALKRHGLARSIDVPETEQKAQIAIKKKLFTLIAEEVYLSILPDSSLKGVELMKVIFGQIQDRGYTFFQVRQETPGKDFDIIIENYKKEITSLKKELDDLRKYNASCLDTLLNLREIIDKFVNKYKQWESSE